MKVTYRMKLGRAGPGSLRFFLFNFLQGYMDFKEDITLILSNTYGTFQTIVSTCTFTLSSRLQCWQIQTLL